MRKLLGIALAAASVGVVAPATEAKAATPSTAAAQWRRQRHNRRAYVTTRSRLVRVGRRVYRETYQVRRLPNGRTTARLISRVRIR